MFIFASKCDPTKTPSALMTRVWSQIVYLKLQNKQTASYQHFFVDLSNEIGTIVKAAVTFLFSLNSYVSGWAISWACYPLFTIIFVLMNVLITWKRGTVLVWDTLLSFWSLKYWEKSNTICAQSYTTFYIQTNVHNTPECPWKAFSAFSNICGYLP
jgi:hypothetical protein